MMSRAPQSSAFQPESQVQEPDSVQMPLRLQSSSVVHWNCVDREVSALRKRRIRAKCRIADINLLF